MIYDVRGEAGKAVDRRNSFHWFGTPLVVLLLGLLSITLLVLMNDINERQRINFAFADALMDLQIKTATAHLWLEEALTEDLKSNAVLARANLADAKRLSQAILRGGKSEYGLQMPALRDPALKAQAERIVELLSKLGTIAELRLSRPEAAGPGSGLDERFDRVFVEIQETASALEDKAERSQVSEYEITKWLFLAISFSWSLIVIAATAGLWTRESRRKRAEDALRNAKDELESRVAQRTAELTDTNRELRQENAVRQRMVDFLRESDSKFRRLSREFQTVLHAIPDNITLISPDLRVLWTNRDTAAAGKTGDIAGQHCCNLWGASTVCTGCPALSCFRTGKAENAQISRPDGSTWDIRAFPVRDDDGKIKNILEIATDITDKITIQAETMRAMHLASIGELAAGVAHEINNPVNGIINYARLLSNRSARESDEHDIAERIAKEGRRIAGIVRSLLSFARYEKEEKKPVRVQQILFESLTLTESQMRKEGIQLRIDLPHDLPEITANQQQIQQVFMNIISNARYALNRKYPAEDEGKILDIHCEEIATDRGPFIRTTFHDHGTGIAPDVLDRVMNPFFSTKPTGEGTGLGLSISHGIVTDHGGRLAINSVEGEYTKVVIDLPAGERDGQDSRNR